MAYVAAFSPVRRPGAGSVGRSVAGRLTFAPRAAPLVYRRRLSAADARRELETVSAGATAPAAGGVGTVFQSGVTAGLTKAQGNTPNQVMKSAGKQAAVAVAATASLAIPVVGPIISGIISLVGPMLMKGKGLGSGCSPDEPALPNMPARLVTPNQATQYFAVNSDVADYYQKCGGVWGASPVQYVTWHWATFGNRKDGVNRVDPFTYPELSGQEQAALTSATAATMPVTTAPSATDIAMFALLQQQQAALAAQVAAKQQQEQAALIQAAQSEALRAQAQVTSASLAAQSSVAQAQAIAAGETAKAQAQVEAAKSAGVAEAVRTAAALAQSRQLAATTAAAGVTSSAERKQTTKWTLIAVVVAVALVTVGTIVTRRRRSGAGRLRLAHA